MLEDWQLWEERHLSSAHFRRSSSWNRTSPLPYEASADMPWRAQHSALGGEVSMTLSVLPICAISSKLLWLCGMSLWVWIKAPLNCAIWVVQCSNWGELGSRYRSSSTPTVWLRDGLAPETRNKAQFVKVNVWVEFLSLQLAVTCWHRKQSTVRPLRKAGTEGPFCFSGVTESHSSLLVALLHLSLLADPFTCPQPLPSSTSASPLHPTLPLRYLTVCVCVSWFKWERGRGRNRPVFSPIRCT